MNEYLKRLSSGYYNVTPPETIWGKRKPHYSDNMKEYEKGSYWNYPKVWGNPDPIGVISPDSVYLQPTRFYNDPKFETIFTKGKNSLLDFFRKNISNKTELPSYLAPKN
tara:strand:+ start:53 stop:379 length:327 start_codon:yes stop_codon:yes gene_type:complete